MLHLVALGGIVIVAYLMGSVCSAILVCRLMGLPDPRQEGSHNPGTTNVLRIGGKGPALLTLAGDMIKGVLPILFGHYLGWNDGALAWIGLAAFLGHLYPLFFRFEGGKGVATAFGVLGALSWPMGLMGAGIWVILFAATRISSLGALVTFSLTPFLAYWFVPKAVSALTLLCLLLLWRHRGNIKALLRGEERRFGKSSGGSSPSS